MLVCSAGQISESLMTTTSGIGFLLPCRAAERFTQVHQHKGARALGNTPWCLKYLPIYSLRLILNSMLSINYALCMCDVKEEA